MKTRWGVIAGIVCLLISMVVAPRVANATVPQDWLYDQYEIDLFGFVEIRQGWRLQEDQHEKDGSIAEARLQLDAGRDFGWGQVKIKGDLLGDLVMERGSGELRDFNLDFSPLDNMDVKLGRQVLTWGTGDLLFINDLFPKDWQSFFIGRDDEYLKAPADAVKVSLFFDLVNLDIVYTPRFNGSTYINGERLSFWNGAALVGRDSRFLANDRNRFFRDSETAMRLSKNFGSIEIALYGYDGFWKTPEGVDPATGRGVYPSLSSGGLSLRASMLGGIGSLETGYYYSGDDGNGRNPWLRNSELRLLAGFERELGDNFTGSGQYYLEHMQDYGAYQRALPPGMKAKDEYRHVLTLRLTKLLLNQNLRLSLFAYYSPSDRDGYLRPKAHYKINDAWAVEIGANLFVGADDHTFFGQFADNSNGFASLRYSF